jgi:putative methyltransferase (TIGR04325 family)
MARAQATAAVESAEARPHPVSQLRIRQVRLFAAVLTRLGNGRRGRAFLIWARQRPVFRALLDGLLGCRRTFPDFDAAQACARRYAPLGHEHPHAVQVDRGLAELTRESDYPVLFHLKPSAASFRRVFDLGGSVGNLFYCYARHLPFAEALSWIVSDLPVKRAEGIRLAMERGEKRLRFTDGLSGAVGADLFIISGAAHYFADPPHRILAKLASLPQRVVINRLPCSRAEPLVTVQDGHAYFVASKLHSRDDLVAGMQALGYRLSATWPVYEHRLWVPLYPDLCYSHYLGFYFELTAPLSDVRPTAVSA